MPTPTPRVIQIHAAAPAKPAPAAPCNGCGVCCLAEPCPVGMLVSRRRSGACDALTWVDREKRYRCGVLGAPGSDGSSPPASSISWRHLWRRMAGRMISAGSGCDCDMELDTEAPWSAGHATDA